MVHVERTFTVFGIMAVLLAGSAHAQQEPPRTHDVVRGHWSAVVASPPLEREDGPGLPVLYLLSFDEDVTAVCTVDALGRLAVVRTFDWKTERPGGTVRPQSIAFADGGRTVYVFDHRAYADDARAPVVKEYRWELGAIVYVAYRDAREVPLTRLRAPCAVAAGRAFRIDATGTLVSEPASATGCGREEGAP